MQCPWCSTRRGGKQQQLNISKGQYILGRCVVDGGILCYEEVSAGCVRCGPDVMLKEQPQLHSIIYKHPTANVQLRVPQLRVVTGKLQVARHVFSVRTPWRDWL